MNREWIDHWCERGILLLVLGILVYAPIATGSVRPTDFLVLQSMTIGALGLWLVRLWLGEPHRLLLPPVSWVVVLFAGYAAVRYFQADIEYVARQEVIRVLLYTCLFFLITTHLHRQESLQVIAYVLFILAAGISAYALYQFATNSPMVLNYLKPPEYMKRASGTFICPNHLAGYLEMILPLALAYLFMSKSGYSVRILIGYVALMMMAGIAVTLSRGGYISAGIAVAMFFILLLRKRSYRLPAIGFLLFLIIVGGLVTSTTRPIRDQMPDRFASKYFKDMRLMIWKSAAEMWWDHPWFGVGPAHFDYRFKEYRPKEIQMRPERVHNDYLNTLADWGVVGATLVAAAWLLLFWGAIKTWKYVRQNPDSLKMRQTNKAAWVQGGCVGLLAILIHAFFDFNFHIPANAILAVALMAFVSTHIRFATDRYWISCGWTLRLLITLFCLGSIGGLGYQGMRSYREQLALNSAQKIQESGLKRAEALEKAWLIEPKNFDTSYEIGEIYRLACFQGDKRSTEWGEKAMGWFKITQSLNPYFALNYLRWGMTLDFLRRFDAAKPLIEKANHLDTNGYFVLAHVGWHWVQLAANEERQGQYGKAREYYHESIKWFDQSQLLNYDQNIVGRRYKEIVLQRLRELGEK